MAAHPSSSPTPPTTGTARPTTHSAAGPSPSSAIPPTARIAAKAADATVELAEAGIDGVVEGAKDNVKEIGRSAGSVATGGLASVAGSVSGALDKEGKKAAETIGGDFVDAMGKAGVFLFEGAKQVAKSTASAVNAAANQVHQAASNVGDAISDKAANLQRDRQIEKIEDPELKQAAIAKREQEAKFEAEKSAFAKRQHEASIAMKDGNAGTLYALDKVDQTVLPGDAIGVLSKDKIASFRSAKGQSDQPQPDKPVMKM